MKHGPEGGGNGSGEFEIGHHDMGGQVRICAGRVNLPEELPVFLSQALTDWFRQRPNLYMRSVAAIERYVIRATSRAPPIDQRHSLLSPAS